MPIAQREISLSSLNFISFLPRCISFFFWWASLHLNSAEPPACSSGNVSSTVQFLWLHRSQYLIMNESTMIITGISKMAIPWSSASILMLTSPILISCNGEIYLIVLMGVCILLCYSSEESNWCTIKNLSRLYIQVIVNISISLQQQQKAFPTRWDWLRGLSDATVFYQKPSLLKSHLD